MQAFSIFTPIIIFKNEWMFLTICLLSFIFLMVIADKPERVKTSISIESNKSDSTQFGGGKTSGDGNGSKW